MNRANINEWNEFNYIREKKFATRSQSCLVRWEGAAEGGADDWGEVVTR